MARRSTGGSRTTELAIEHVGYACLVLRRRTDGGDGWFEALQLPRAGLRPAGEHVRSCSRRATASPSSSPTLHSSTGGYASPTTRSSPRSRASPGPRGSRDSDLAARTRAAVLGKLDPPTARLIRELDGSRTLGEAREVVEDADMEKAGLDIARRMVEVGFLELAD